MYLTLKDVSLLLFNAVRVVGESQQGACLNKKFKSYPQLENSLNPT